MPRIYVCPLSKLSETVRVSGAQSLITLVDMGTSVSRPAAIVPGLHLALNFSDITVETAGHMLVSSSHVERLLAFVRRWDQAAPLLIHCFAGVSRSTAAAYIAACALLPQQDESRLAAALRKNSPTATPNPRLVAIADAVLTRQGRMVEAIASIGRGRDCAEASPFALELR
jgi:predicted protein tyrosine phosphatase